MQVTDETGDACTRVQQASYCQQRGDQEQNSACGRRVIDRGIVSVRPTRTWRLRTRASARASRPGPTSRSAANAVDSPVPRPRRTWRPRTAQHSTAQHSTAQHESQPRPRFRPGDDHHGTPRSTEDNEPDRSPRHWPPRGQLSGLPARTHPWPSNHHRKSAVRAGTQRLPSHNHEPSAECLGVGPVVLTGIILVYASRARVKRPQGHRESIRLLVQGCCPVAAGPVETG